MQGTATPSSRTAGSSVPKPDERDDDAARARGLADVAVMWMPPKTSGVSAAAVSPRRGERGEEEPAEEELLAQRRGDAHDDRGDDDARGALLPELLEQLSWSRSVTSTLAGEPADDHEADVEEHRPADRRQKCGSRRPKCRAQVAPTSGRQAERAPTKPRSCTNVAPRFTPGRGRPGRARRRRRPGDDQPAEERDARARRAPRRKPTTVGQACGARLGRRRALRQLGPGLPGRRGHCRSRYCTSASVRDGADTGGRAAPQDEHRLDPGRPRAADVGLEVSPTCSASAPAPPARAPRRRAPGPASPRRARPT